MQRRERALRVCVDGQHSVAAKGKALGDRGRRRGLADSSLEIGDGDGRTRG